MDLFNEANLIFFQLIPEYLKVCKTISAEEFFYERIRRKVDSYFWKKVLQSEPGIHSIFKARYKKGTHGRDREKLATWLNTFAVRQESPQSVAVSSELIDIAWSFLDDLVPYKRDLIVQSILGATAAELSDDFGMDIRTVKKELASIEAELRKKARKRDEAFMERLSAKSSSAGLESSAAPLKIEELFKVLIKDKAGNIIEGCSPRRTLPNRVLRLIDRGKVGMITNLFIGEGDFLVLSPQMCYDFRRLDHFSGKSIIAHFNGNNKPSHFTIFDKGVPRGHP